MGILWDWVETFGVGITWTYSAVIRNADILKLSGSTFYDEADSFSSAEICACRVKVCVYCRLFPRQCYSNFMLIILLFSTLNSYIFLVQRHGNGCVGTDIKLIRTLCATVSFKPNLLNFVYFIYNFSVNFRPLQRIVICTRIQFCTSANSPNWQTD